MLILKFSNLIKVFSFFLDLRRQKIFRSFKQCGNVIQISSYIFATAVPWKLKSEKLQNVQTKIFKFYFNFALLITL